MSDPFRLPVQATTPQLRCALALNLLQQRPHDDRTVELVAAVMRGVSLGELVDLEVNG
jgi:hypothetical protein